MCWIVKLVARAVRARVNAAWKKWKDKAILLTDKRTPLRIRGSVYESCIRSVMLFGSETWAMTKKDEDILRKCEKNAEIHGKSKVAGWSFK